MCRFSSVQCNEQLERARQQPWKLVEPKNDVVPSFFVLQYAKEPLSNSG